MARALERIKRLILIERFLPALTVVGAITAFSLSLVALLATAKNGLQQFDVVMVRALNQFDQDSLTCYLAQYNYCLPKPSSNRKCSLDYREGITPIRNRLFRDSPRQIFPGAPQVSSTVSSELSTGISPSPTAGTPAAKQGNDLASSLQDLANVLVGTKSGAAGEQLLQVIDRIMSVIVDSLEMKEWYGIYMRKLCAGNYVLNASRGETTMQATGCVSFGDVNMQPSLSTVQIGTTRVDFSTVNFQTKSPQHRDY